METDQLTSGCRAKKNPILRPDVAQLHTEVLRVWPYLGLPNVLMSLARVFKTSVDLVD